MNNQFPIVTLNLQRVQHKFRSTPSFPNFSILADVPPESGYTRHFSYCVKITNQEKYPNYLLFLQIGSSNRKISPSPYILMRTGECFPLSTTYHRLVTISAIAQDKVEPEDLENNVQGTILHNVDLQKALIKGNPIISPPSEIPVIYSFRPIEGNFQIESLTPNSLQLSVKRDFQPPLNWIVFPIVGMAILGWVIWRRRRRTE